MTTAQPVHTLYRFFDADGVLLYVGRTIDARSRFRTHERSKEWFNTVARIERQIFPTAEALAKAEVSAIKSEDPLHNVQHSTRQRSTRVAPQVVHDGDDRVQLRQAITEERWGPIPSELCDEAEPESGCECAVCVESVFVRLDIYRMDRADDLVLVGKLDALEDDYLAGADAIDWFYDLDDLMMFRRWRLMGHSVLVPAPTYATISDGLMRVSCPFCLDLHEHYIASGAAIGTLDAACLGKGKYVPVLDFHDATERSLTWLRKVPA